MCGSDKLTTINLRMQEIMGNTNFMGGVSVVCTGDFGQLPPVGDNMIWQNSVIDGRSEMAPNYWKKYFKIFYLTEKMRSLDYEFSNISDKVRKGICDSDVMNYLNKHVRECPNENDNLKYAEGKLSIIVTNNEDRERINLEKLNKLLPNEKSYTMSSKDEATNLRNPPEISKKIPLTQTGQLEHQIVFKKGAPVMITSNHHQQRYKNNGIVNGSRGYIDSIQTSKTNNDEIEVIWVCFNDANTGKLLREDNKALLRHHKPNNPNAVPIKKQRKQFKMQGNASWLREQFPLTLCYAITAHKSQGQTLEEVIIDFSSKKSKVAAGSFYTAMSRVRNGRNLFLRDFKTEYIHANPNVEARLYAMKLTDPYSFKKVTLDKEIFELTNEETKIGYININSLKDSMSLKFINEDVNLLNLDYLAIADTRLTEEDEVLRELSNWNVLCKFDTKDKVRHMGMLLLQSKGSFSKHGDILKNKWMKEVSGRHMVFAQIITLKLTKSIKSVNFVYLRETPSMKEIQALRKYVSNSDITMGDLNLDPNRESDYSNLIYLLGNDKKRVLYEVTTTHINQLDHVIIDKKIDEYFCTSYNNHTSDHKAITIRIPNEENEISEEFKREHFVKNNHWIKKPTLENTTVFSDGQIFENIVKQHMEILNMDNSKKHVFMLDIKDIKSQTFFNDLPPALKDIKILKNLNEVFFIIDDISTSYILQWRADNITLYQEKSGESLMMYQKGLTLLQALKKCYVDKVYQSFKIEIPKLKLYCEESFEKSDKKLNRMISILTFLKFKIIGNLPNNIITRDFKKQLESIEIEINSGKLDQHNQPEKEKFPKATHQAKKQN